MGDAITAHGVSAGSTSIRAQAGGAQMTTTVAILPVAARLRLNPECAMLPVGAALTFTASAHDANGDPIPDLTFSFSLGDSSPPGAASIISTTSNTVAVRGDSAGAVTLTATYRRPGDDLALEAASVITVVNAPVPTGGQVIINEALVSFSTSGTQMRQDFIELYNMTTRALDISGLVVRFRPAGSGSAPGSITLPGALGSGTTVIQPQGYFLIANGASTFGVMADYDASAAGFDLNGTSGGVEIEISCVRLDGFAYQGSSAALPRPFETYAEGVLFKFMTGATNDLIRHPNATDTNDNAGDFRRNGTATSVSPKKPNPTVSP